MENELIIYNTDDGKADVKLYSRDGVIWMNQQQMALLFDTSKQLVSHHIANVLQDKELEEKSVVKDYLTTAADGKNYNVTYYALPMVSSDYDGIDKATQMFFAETQNKLIYAVTNQTAPEIILSRADSSKPNMNLTTWKGKVVRKQDIYISKNYLTDDELDTLNRLVSIFLDTAELRVKMRKTLTLQFWEDNIDKLITDNDFKLLDDKGSRSRFQADKEVEQIYLEFNKRRKEYEAKEADKQDEQELKALEEAEKKVLGRKK